MHWQDVEFYLLRGAIAIALLWVSRRELAGLVHRVLHRNTREEKTVSDRLDDVRGWLLVVGIGGFLIFALLLLLVPSPPIWAIYALAAVSLGALSVGSLLSIALGWMDGGRPPGRPRQGRK
jgi:hypothetical protein